MKRLILFLTAVSITLRSQEYTLLKVKSGLCPNFPSKREP